MRQISADLQAVQLVRSPRARVTCTVEGRGQNPDVPPLVWSELVTNAGQSSFRPVALVGLANGSILKFQAQATECRMYTIVDPTEANDWTGASFSVVVAAGLTSLAALRVPNTPTIRLFYTRSSGNVLYIESTNNGASWGSPVTVYSGGDAVLDLCVAYINNGVTVNGPWFFGFTTQSAGVYTPRFGYHNGSSWVTFAYDADWRAAGIDAYGPAASQVRCFVSKTRTIGASKLRYLDLLNGVYGVYGWSDIDHTQAGLFGVELAYYRFCQLPEAGCMLGVVGESAYGAGIHLGVGGFFTPGSLFADEPIMFPSIAGVSSQPYCGLCSVGDDPASASVYLAGDMVVWRGEAQATTATTLEAVKYVYDDGELEIEFGLDSTAEGAGNADLYVGQILVVSRTLSWDTQSGSETFRAMIVRVEQGTVTERGAPSGSSMSGMNKVKVIALDALGWLGTARCRRPSILNDGNAPGVAFVMGKLAARFGIAVGVDNADLNTASVMPFTLAPSESLAGAAFRVGSQSEFYLVPANDGSFALTMITPGTSDSGDYDDTPHEYGVAPSQQPIAKAAAISDYRVLAFSYVLGTRSTDPQDGGAIAMAAGPVVPNTRPMSYSLTNSRYNTTARVEAAASAEGERQKRLPITGMIEGQANLALELYDRVEVTEPSLGWSAKAFRVRRIKEQYDRGRLWQTVYLGDE